MIKLFWVEPPERARQDRELGSRSSRYRDGSPRDTEASMDSGARQGMHQQMVDEVALHTKFVADVIGKAHLSNGVMATLAKVPRHEFVPTEVQPLAYLDTPLPIGHEKTISQPFIVALMVDLLDLHRDETVLEVGTGLGYQAALLSELGAHVYSVEIIEELAESAKERLARLGYESVQIRVGNGKYGWPEHAPFDKIVVSASSELMPPELLKQLKTGGRMIVPTGIEEAQRLLLAERTADGRIETTELLPVRFALLEDQDSFE